MLGIAGATLMPSTLALIRNMFHDEKQRRTAIAIWTAATMSAIALGPVLSGILLNHFWWGSVFLINIPFMVLLLALGPVLLPEFRPPGPGRFDLTGSLLSLGAVLPAIYGIKEIAANGFDAARATWIVAGVVVGAAFIVRQSRAAEPMIDLKLFRSRGFTGSVAMNLVAMFAIAGFAIFATQFLQSVLGMRPLTAALWSLVPMTGTAIAAPLTQVLAGRVDRAYLAAGEFLLAGAGFGLLTRLHATSPIWFIMIGAACYAGGMVAVMAIGSELIMGAVQPERAGAAAAVAETATEFGGAPHPERQRHHRVKSVAGMTSETQWCRSPGWELGPLAAGEQGSGKATICPVNWPAPGGVTRHESGGVPGSASLVTCGTCVTSAMRARGGSP